MFPERVAFVTKHGCGYLLMVRLTVALCGASAGVPGAVPVMVIDPVPVRDDPPPEQPATATKTNIAAAIPKRFRRRCVIGIMNSIEIPRTRKTTCRIDADGGALIDSGGAINDTVATTLAVAVGLVIPAVTSTLVGISVHEVTLDVPAQVRFTVPVKPCEPVTVTGIEAAMPLVRLAEAGAVTVKAPVAEPVPVSATEKG